MPTATATYTGEAATLTFGRDAEEGRAAEQPRLEEGHDHRDRQGDKAEAEEETDPAEVHARGSCEHLTPGAPAGEAKRSPGPPCRTREQEHEQHRQSHEHEEYERGLLDGAPQGVGARRDGAAEEVGRASAERTAAGDGEAAAAPALGPLDGLRPL